MRRAVRHAVPFVSNRPWLVSLAARAFARSPSLKYRVRRIMAPSSAVADLPAGRGDRALTPAEAAALSDLRDAIAARKNAG
jgi:hypothetical protein